MSANILLNLNDSITNNLRNTMANGPIFIVENQICEIAQRMHILEPEQHIGILVANSPAVTPYAKLYNSRRNIYAISVPYTFLINTNNLHAIEGFTFLDDLRDYTNEQILDIHHTLQDQFGLPRTKLSIEEYEGFRMFLHYIRDYEKSEKAKIFTLGHEVAHIAYQHVCIPAPPIPTTIKWLGKLGLVGDRIKIRGCQHIGSLRENHCHYRTRELEADRASAVICRDMGAQEGGMYLFKSITEAGKRARENSVLFKAVFDEQGSCSSYMHPLSHERINNIELYQTLPDEMTDLEHLKIESEILAKLWKRNPEFYIPLQIQNGQELIEMSELMQTRELLTPLDGELADDEQLINGSNSEIEDPIAAGIVYEEITDLENN